MDQVIEVGDDDERQFSRTYRRTPGTPGPSRSPLSGTEGSPSVREAPRGLGLHYQDYLSPDAYEIEHHDYESSTDTPRQLGAPTPSPRRVGVTTHRIGNIASAQEPPPRQSQYQDYLSPTAYDIEHHDYESSTDTPRQLGAPTPSPRKIGVTTHRVENITSAQSRTPRQPPEKKPAKEKTIIEWFDISVSEELSKQRQKAPRRMKVVEKSGAGHPLMLHAMASEMEMRSNLGYRNTELKEAVEQLAKAEALVTFEGAVKAAEEAAARAPPGMAEEAAAAGAKGYQAELTSIVAQRLTADMKPVEVIGYVGVTRPTMPKKSNV